MSSLKSSNEALQALHVLLLNIFIAAILLALFTLPLQLLPDALLKLSAQSEEPAVSGSTGPTSKGFPATQRSLDLSGNTVRSWTLPGMEVPPQLTTFTE